jgi:hypothetical protein
VPVTDETLRLAAGLRLVIGTTVDQATDALVRAWAAAWNLLLPEWADALREATEQVHDGETTWAKWARTERARQALQITAEALDRLSKAAGVTISGNVETVVGVTAEGHDGLIASQLPSRAVVAVDWVRVDPKALDAIVKRTTKQITARTKPISADATRAIKEGLVKGVAEGLHPRNAARIMLDRTKGEFAGGLTRAMTVARTELLDAHRAAGMASDKASKKVVTGWVWTCALSPRTCPSCLAMNGTEHPISEPGPLDHVNGRCSRTPKAKSWADLGIDIPEPPSIQPDARAWFDSQDQATQALIMGKARLDLLKSGQIGWDDLPVKRDNPDWRPAYQVRSVADLKAKT